MKPNFVSVETFPGESYPMYAFGEGYAVSKEFAACAAGWNLGEIPLLPSEAISTGLLAEACGFSCQDDEWEWWNHPENPAGVVHPLLKSQHMATVWRRDEWRKLPLSGK